MHSSGLGTCTHSPQGPAEVGAQGTRGDKCPGLWDKHHPILILGSHFMVAVQAPVFQSSLFLRTVWLWASCLTPLSLCEMGVSYPYLMELWCELMS